VSVEKPIGFVPLREAVDRVGKVVGPNEAERTIAEACEAGRIAAAYRSLDGVDDLDRSVWRMPHWRNYFATGKIDLDLPAFDLSCRPHPHDTARCPREVFVREDSLAQFIAELAPAAPAARERRTGGAPAKYDYDQIRAHAFRAFKEKGLPDPGGDDQSWRTRADLEREIADLCRRRFDDEPAKSTLQGYARRCIDDWARREADKGR
jgi:hypothetical protein